MYSYHTCAIKNDGTTWCWGKGSNGRLGNDSTINQTTPTQVSNLSSTYTLGGYEDHTCSVKNDDSIWCWGGQKDSDDRISNIPIQVSNITTGSHLPKGNWMASCAITTDTNVWCW